VTPTIDKAEDSKGVEIPQCGTTDDTTVKLTGTASKGQKVQIKDDNTVKGEATVNLTTGVWELIVTGLSVTTHSFTATALYGSGQASAARVVVVTSVILSENFENVSGLEPIILDIPSMKIERTPREGERIVILDSDSYERPIYGNYLLVNGEEKTITFTFRHVYSYISFNYAHTYLPGTTAKFYDSNNRPLGERTLLTSSIGNTGFIEFQGAGIQKMIVTTGPTAIVFDNFIFRL